MTYKEAKGILRIYCNNVYIFNNAAMAPMETESFTLSASDVIGAARQKCSSLEP